MTKEYIKILLIEDDEDDYILTRSYLTDNEKFDFHIDWEHEFDKGLERVKAAEHDIYLIDYMLGSFSGIELLVQGRQSGCDKPMIMLTGQDSYQTDINAMISGASDYLVKGEINTSLLERAIRYNIDRYNNLKNLREQEIKYRLLFEESLDAVFISDEDMNFLDVNYSFRKLFNVLPEDVNKLNLMDLFKDKKKFESLKKSVLSTGYVINEDVVLKDADGSNKSCLISLNRMGLQDFQQPILQGIIKDITSLKQTEKELRNTEKIVLTGNMARSVAHEVRNPLTNIMLSIKQLEKKCEEVSSDNVIKNYLQIAQKNAVVINTLIDEMLRASNPGEMNFKDHSLNSVLQSSVEFCKDRLNLQEVDLKENLDPSIPEIPLDFEQLKRAFTNIIINAVEAMDQTEKRLLIVTSEGHAEYISVRIEDTGSGIDESKLENLFEPFSTFKSGGMGLGLTSVQNIMNKHHAEINVNSSVGKGTVFEFIFPLNEAKDN
jgi:PAS domain S-box-containing protein